MHDGSLSGRIRKCVSMCVAIIIVIVLVILALFSIRVTSPSPTVGSVRLNIETYIAGKNQLTHPAVYAFDKPWNGYTYWMAYSPYPFANGEEENPCIAVSNDLRHWITPAGLVNPIAYNEDTGCNELKDPHIVYRKDLDQIEVWYLGKLSENLGGDGNSLLLMRKCSKDGIHWSDYEIMSKTKYLSPSVIWNGEKYQIWGIGYDMLNTTGTFVYQESTDGKTWSNPVPCSINGKSSGLDIWHGAVIQNNETFYFVFIDNDKQKVYCCKSKDGLNFDSANVIVDNNGYWQHLYRPTLLVEDNTITCFYGIVDNEGQWYISLSSGNSLDSLTGLRESDISSMTPLNDSMVDTHSLRYNIEILFNSVNSYFYIEILAIAFFEAFVVFLIRVLSRKQWFFNLCAFANLVLTLGYMCYRHMPVVAADWFGIILVACILNIILDSVLFCAVNFIRKKNPKNIKNKRN